MGEHCATVRIVPRRDNETPFIFRSPYPNEVSLQLDVIPREVVIYRLREKIAEGEAVCPR
jgi:hypothetical protein